MSSSSFPLLRLPSLALREIIEQIELKEQFNLSLCSKRMHLIVKHYRDKSTIFLKLFSMGEDVGVSFFKERSSEDEVTIKIKADVKGVPYNWNSRKQFRRTELLIDHLCDLFRARVRKVIVKNNKIWMLDIVEERQGAFSYDAEVWNFRYGHNDEKLRHILLDLNPKSLDIHQQASDQFRIENFHKKFEKLTISPATWMTDENLCQLDCVELEIHRYLSSTEINRYLKHVLSGGAPRLKEFRADVQSANEDVMLDGIRELLTGSERVIDEHGNRHLNGKVARGEGLVLVSVRCSRFGIVNLEIQDA